MARFVWSSLFIFLLSFASAFASANKFAYSGRLVQADGTPVTGPVQLKFDLYYADDMLTVLDTDTVSGVDLSNGVFTVELEFASIATVMQGVFTGKQLMVVITDQTNTVTYDPQAVLGVPMANIAGTAQKLSLACAQDKVVAYDASGNLVCADNGTGGVTSVTGAANGAISVGGTSAAPNIAVNVDNSSIEISSNNLRIKPGASTGQILTTSAGAAAWASMYCATSGEYLKGIDGSGSIVCGTPADTTVTGGNGIDVTTGVASVDLAASSGMDFAMGKLYILDTEFQRTVADSCAAGEAIVAIANNGAATCEDMTPDLDGQTTACADGQILKADSGSFICADANEVAAAASSASGTASITTTNGSDVITISETVSLNEGDYLVPDTSTSEARAIKVGGTGTAFTADKNYGSNVTSETYVVYPPKLKVDNDLIVQGSTGNVGIGTTTPSERLDVSGASGSQRLSLSSADGSGNHAIAFKDGTTTEWLLERHDATNQLRITEEGVANQLVIAPGGNIGAGTTTPSEKLEVNGNVKATAFYGDGSNLTGVAASGSSNTGDNTITADSDSDTNGSILFQTAGTTKAVIDNSGNVGIGTTTPTKKLEVAGDIQSDRSHFATSGFYLDNVGSTGLGIFNDDNNLHAEFRDIGGGAPFSTALWLGSYGNFNYPNYSFKQDTNTGMAGGGAADTLYLITGGSPRFTLNAVGNAGLGTTAPTTSLHINADIPGIRLQDNTSSDNHYITGNNAELFMQTTGEITFKPNNAEAMRLTSAGKVGIGTSGPGHTLTVQGSAPVSGAFAGYSGKTDSNTSPLGYAPDIVSQRPNGTGTSPTYRGGIGIGPGGVGMYSLNPNPAGSSYYGDLRFYTTVWDGANSHYDVYDRMVITQGGSVGIGNSAPEALVDIREASGSGQASLRFQSGASDPGMSIGVDGADGHKFKIADSFNLASGTHFTIDQSGNAGIGTSVPDQKLHVSGGNAKVEHNAPILVLKDSDSTGDSHYGFISLHDNTGAEQGWMGFGSAVNDDLSLKNNYTGGHILLQTTSTGNVGIGNTSPTEKLEVTGNVKATAFYGDGSNLTGVAASASTNTGDNTIAADSDSDTNGSIIFQTAGSTKAVINNAGNMGIGTAAPSYKMEVSSSDAAFASYIQNTNASGYGLGIKTSGTDATRYAFDIENGSAGNSIMRVLNNGNAGFGVTAPTEKLEVQGNILAKGSNVMVSNGGSPYGTSMYSPAANELAFSSNSAEAIRINSAGKVGIGTSSPQSRLEVLESSPGSVTYPLSITNPSNAANSGAALRFRGTNTTGSVVEYADIKSVYTNTTAGAEESDIIFQSRNNALTQEQMRITGDGNVGIGSSAPSARLEVVGTNDDTTPESPTSNIFSIGNNSLVDGSYTYMGFNNASGQAASAILSEHVEAQGSYANADGFGFKDSTLKFQTSNPLSNGSITTKMTITGDGKVGIGTSSPTDPLVIARKSTDSFPARILLTDTQGLGGIHDEDGSADYGVSISPDLRTIGNGGVYFSAHTGGGDGTSSKIVFRGGHGPSEHGHSRDIMTMDTSNGNIGIGTSSPATTLEIANDGGEVIALRDKNSLESDVGYVSYLRAKDSAGTNVWYIGDGSSGAKGLWLLNYQANPIHFATNGSTKMTVAGNGYVGIGTTSPSYTLHVNGSVAGTSAYNNLSDERLKKNFSPIAAEQSALEKLLQINGVYFDWRQDEYPEMDFEEGRDMGVIAQEVERVFPEAVSIAKDTDIKSVAYSKLIAPIIEAIRELFQENQSLKEEVDRKIASVHSENEKLRKKTKEQDEEIKNLKAQNELIKSVLCDMKPNATLCQ